MPTPRKGESEKDFVARCIPQVIKEGTAKDGSQGSAVCHSMYRQHQKKKRAYSDVIAGVTGAFVIELFGSFEEFNSFEAQNGRPKTHVQTLIMSKERFPTRASAKQWAKANGFKSDTVRETTKSWRLRQRPPEDFIQTSFRVINMTTGVQAVIGHLK
jgi:hypothetical protein